MIKESNCLTVLLSQGEIVFFLSWLRTHHSFQTVISQLKSSLTVTMEEYGTAVIGAGMIGSSAARYLATAVSSSSAALPNVLIGPTEEQVCKGLVLIFWIRM